MKIRLRRDDLRAIEAHARENFPHECCGLLLGKFSDDFVEVEGVVKAENVLGSPIAFEVDAELVFKAIDWAEKSGRELVGIYHSHPNFPAYVSSPDNEAMKLWPCVAWLILSVTAQGVKEQKAYATMKEKILELEICVS